MNYTAVRIESGPGYAVSIILLRVWVLAMRLYLVEM